MSGLTCDVPVVTGTVRAACGWLKILGVATGGLGLALVFWVGGGGFKADAATLQTVSRVHYAENDISLTFAKDSLAWACACACACARACSCCEGAADAICAVALGCRCRCKGSHSSRDYHSEIKKHSEHAR